jgi:DNA repair proteins
MTDVFLYSLTKAYNRLSLFPEKHAEIEDDDFIRDAKDPNAFAKRIVNLVNELTNLSMRPEEHLMIVTFSGMLIPTGVFEISHGTKHQTLSAMAQIVTRALLINADAIIVLHNHPGGIVTESETDIETVTALKNLIKPLDLTVVDSIIVGEKSGSTIFNSFRERGLL